MKENLYILENEAEVGEIGRALERDSEDISTSTERIGDLLYYEGNTIEAVFSPHRAYLRQENGAGNMSDLSVISFLEYESIHKLGLKYRKVARPEFNEIP